MMYRAFKYFLFLLSPERAHHLALNSFKILLSLPLIGSLVRRKYKEKSPNLRRECMGLQFDNPVGLAAGFDKEAKWIDTVDAMGFGFVEIGTITPRPQSGNPKPRLFRLIRDEAIINRMGFNNEGLEGAIANLKKKKSKVVIGGNIGKNKVTPNEEAKSDYAECFEALYPYVDYFVINVSSPNTPGLRELQNKKPLQEIIQTVLDLNDKKEIAKPVLLKIAPDLTKEQCEEVAEIVRESKLSGLICTNTTIRRDLLSIPKARLSEIGAGGLSGAPLFPMSLHLVKWFRDHIREDQTLIAVGGINSAHRAQQMLDAGADLLQIYSGLIYEGPRLVKNILKGIQ